MGHHDKYIAYVQHLDAKGKVLRTTHEPIYDYVDENNKNHARDLTALARRKFPEPRYRIEKVIAAVYYAP